MKSQSFLLYACLSTFILLINRCNSFYYNGNEHYKRLSDNYQDLSDAAGLNSGESSILFNRLMSTRSDEDVGMLNNGREKKANSLLQEREARHGRCVVHKHCKSGQYCYNEYCHSMPLPCRRQRQLDDDDNDLTALQLDEYEDQELYRSPHFASRERSGSRCTGHDDCTYGRRCSCHFFCEDIG